MQLCVKLKKWAEFFLLLLEIVHHSEKHFSLKSMKEDKIWIGSLVVIYV